jgi:septum formation inhibitor-activating ATPase MinD
VTNPEVSSVRDSTAFGHAGQLNQTPRHQTRSRQEHLLITHQPAASTRANAVAGDIKDIHASS